MATFVVVMNEFALNTHNVQIDNNDRFNRIDRLNRSTNEWLGNYYPYLN